MLEPIGRMTKKLLGLLSTRTNIQIFKHLVVLGQT
jgi:hypothetical protein